jgi:exopolysaccharide biosynthesis protein
VAPTCSTAFCRANPRTGIGYTEHGGIILVVVDGRQPRWSIGATLGQFAEIMRKFGAVQAMNLDGGGSTTMVVQGKVVNEPSDGHARSLTNAVLVLPGPDPGES